jgi:uncharacterized protein YndB with AHSA1/START domain
MAMASQWGILETSGGVSVLRFERRIEVTAERLWRALTEPHELVKWFPGDMQVELRPGGTVRFGAGEVGAGEVGAEDEGAEEEGAEESGTVLDVDPLRLLAFTWGDSTLRWEIAAAGGGAFLRFSQTLGPRSGGRLAAAQHAAGWDGCLDALAAVLEGRRPRGSGPAEDAGEQAELLARMEAYAQRFGLDQGAVVPTADGYAVRFERHLTWRPPEEVWAVLVTGSLDATADEPLEQPAPGDRPPWPMRNGYVDADEVRECRPPQLLAYDWLTHGAQAGEVRWELATAGNVGTAVTLTQTVPAALSGQLALYLAAWHTHLELLFAALAGELRLPWPEERTEELRRRYEAQLPAHA